MTDDTQDGFDPYPDRELMADQERRTMPDDTPSDAVGNAVLLLYIGVSLIAGTLAATLVESWVLSATAFLGVAIATVGLCALVGVAVVRS